MQPIRQCCACRKRQSQQELLRFVCGLNGHPQLDLRCKLPGRGAYLCPQFKCLQRGIKPKGLAQSLGCGPPQQSAEELREIALHGVTRQLNEALSHAHRAGLVVWGRDRVQEALNWGRVKQLWIAWDTAYRTQREFAQQTGPERTIHALSKAELSRVLGQPEVGVLAITEPHLGERIRALASCWHGLKEENGNGQG